MLLILNLIPIAGEWASVAREWIENNWLTKVEMNNL